MAAAASGDISSTLRGLASASQRIPTTTRSFTPRCEYAIRCGDALTRKLLFGDVTCSNFMMDILVGMELPTPSGVWLFCAEKCVGLDDEPQIGAFFGDVHYTFPWILVTGPYIANRLASLLMNKFLLKVVRAELPNGVDQSKGLTCMFREINRS